MRIFVLETFYPKILVLTIIDWESVVGEIFVQTTIDWESVVGEIIICGFLSEKTFYRKILVLGYIPQNGGVTASHRSAVPKFKTSEVFGTLVKFFGVGDGL